MKKAAFAVAAVVILIAAGIFIGLPVAEKQAALELRAELERSGEVMVGTVEVGLLGRHVVLSDVTAGGGNGTDFELTVAHLDVQGLAWPLAELLHGRTPFSGFRWGDPLQAGRVEAQDVRLIDRGAMTEWRAASIVADDVDLARFDGVVAGGGRGVELPARVLEALTVRRLEQHAVALSSLSDLWTFSFGSVVAERYDHGRIGSLVVGDLKVVGKDAPATVFVVHEISTLGLDSRKLLATLASGAWQAGKPLGRLWADRLVVADIGGGLLERYGVSIERITTEQSRESDLVTRAHTRIDGFVVNPPPANAATLELRTGLDAIDISALKMKLDCASREDHGAGVLKIENCTLAAPGLAEIGFGMTVVGADGQFWRGVDEGDFRGMATTKAALGAAELVIADKSLLERSLKAAAKSSGTPLVLLRPLMALQIRKYQPPGVLITEELSKLADTVARFVEQGGTLTLAARPEPPFAFSRGSYLLTPGPDLVSVFGLSASLSK